MNEQDNKISPQEALDNLRHSCAHLLAAAVMQLWPDTKRTIGPAIENGFYFDFEFSHPISEVDFPKIEETMKEIVKSWKGFERHELSASDAKKEYPDNPYKHELIDEFTKDGQSVSFYKSGDYWDLCRGGHIPHPNNKIKHFKLMSIAGAYWRGSEKNKMLTRIYGTCFPTKVELDTYLEQREEAKRRDHRKLGAELELFTFDDLSGPGLPLWLPNGTIIKDELEKFAKETEFKWGYQRVSTPHVAKKELFETSGHLPYYADSMFPGMKLDDGTYYLKAMNCPQTHLIYRSKPRSYRDLPLRFAEYGSVYRYELSGTLTGLHRVRGMSMNDAHIYVTQEQIEEEFLKVIQMHKFYYDSFGIKEYYMRLSLHDPKNTEKFIDEPEMWKFSEDAIRKAMQKSDLPFVEAVGEAAFYGPKIDFQIKTVIGKEETASTNQLDFAASKRFNLTYTDKDGQQKPLFVLHRAPLGTHERFIAFLIEHYAGKFPLWLSPVQVKVIPIADRHIEHAQKVVDFLRNSFIRAEIDMRSESMQSKIRDATLQKVPYMGIIGDKEADPPKTEVADYLLSVRNRDGKNVGQISASQFLHSLQNEIETKQ